MNAALPDLVVDSATGVDVSLPVAGAGARSYAFVIDWHIRLVLALTWYVLGAMIFNRAWNIAPPDDAEGVWFGLIVLPAMLLYFLYHPLLEIAMRGRTPGKRMAGVRIVTRDGAPPAVTAHLIRNVFRLVDQFPAFYPLGLITVIATRDHVRVGDLAAGTLLIYDRRDEAALENLNAEVIGRQLDVSLAEVTNELLQRWAALEPVVRRRLALSLLTRAARPNAIATAQANASATAPVLETLDDQALKLRLQNLAKGALS